MLTIHGAGVGKGIAIGKAFVLQRDRLDIPEYVVPPALIDREVERFENAVAKAKEQLVAIRKQIPKSAPPETSGFIDVHLLMLEDKMLVEAPVHAIRKQSTNAERALLQQANALNEVFDQMTDPYLRSKKADIDQVVDRVQRNLMSLDEQEHDRLPEEAKDRIIVANDLTPADTVVLKNHRVRAFVTNLGGPISHTAILARGLKIPAIVGLHGATSYLRNGEDVIVDGKRGVVIIAPDPDLVRYYSRRKRSIEKRRQDLKALQSSPSVTLDGKDVVLMANIELPGDVRSVHAAHAAGVGLYRTEYLYMNRSDPPSETEQFTAYVKVIKALKGIPVTIRTLDLGADKQVDGRVDPGGTNPALGLRAVRLCLKEPALFRPQLRAILRASAFGPVQIMIPMVSSLDEVDQVRDIIEETKAELNQEGQPFDANLPVGGMVEVPAAAISADLFARRLDFLSIGTNDLIQYTLAIDRVDDSVNYLYDPIHPSVLRLIYITIRAAEHAGIPLTMCGEMAGDLKFTRLLLGMGMRTLSMDPAVLLEVKKVVRECSVKRLKKFADKVLRAGSTEETHSLVRQINQLDFSTTRL